MSRARPVVGLVGNRRLEDGVFVQRMPEQYALAVRDAIGATPVLIPALDPPLAAAEMLPLCDGLLFPGDESNIDPAHYGAAPRDRDALRDPARDAMALPLIRAAAAMQKPFLCICRGFQEMNVAFGGTLHQAVHEIDGRLDHREASTAAHEIQWGPSHPVQVAPDGMLETILGAASFMVNSLHGQGVDALAPELTDEAFAPDGQIEAASLKNAATFALGVQWHPEWQWQHHESARALFAAFGRALAAS